MPAWLVKLARILAPMVIREMAAYVFLMLRRSSARSEERPEPHADGVGQKAPEEESSSG